jgi:hypothetical protein
MMNRIAILIQALALLAAAGFHARALDVIALEAGGELRGEIITRTDAAVRLDLLPGEISLSTDNIREIRKEENPQWYLKRIRGRHPATAATILDSALRAGCSDKAIQDKYVELCVSAARGLHADGSPARAAELLRRALVIRPADPRATALLKKAEASERRALAELRALRSELTSRPDNDYARFMLGEIYRKLGRDKDAFAQYKRIVDGRVPFDGGIDKIDELRSFIRANLRIEDAAPVEDAAPAQLGAMQKAELPGLDIHFHDARLGRRLVDELPAIRERLAARLGCEAAGPFVIRVLRNRDEFVAATGNRFGDGHSSGKCVWTYHGAPGILANIVPHELAHVMLAKAAGRMPRWLDEGLAVRQEAAAGAYWQILRDGGRMPLRQLLAADFRADTKGENDRLYASAYSLVDMLIQNGGMERIRRLITALKTLSAEKAFADVYEMQSLRELEDRWAAHLEE